MLRTHFIILVAGLLFAVTGKSAFAAQLQVRPVLVDVRAPGASSTITLRNAGKEKVNAQVRIFRWTQKNGKDVLTPTRKVVASPPFIKMKPGGTYNLRVIRISKKPAKGEEAYRMIVDQLPETRTKKQTTTVKFNVRYSIPVFFAPVTVTKPVVSWSYSGKGGKMALTAKNTGGSRMRISALSLKSGSGSVRTISRGLAGYVLAGSRYVWKKRGKLKGARRGVTVLAKGNNAKVRATARIR